MPKEGKGGEKEEKGREGEGKNENMTMNITQTF
jgi:hypothetical protein